MIYKGSKLVIIFCYAIIIADTIFFFSFGFVPLYVNLFDCDLNVNNYTLRYLYIMIIAVFLSLGFGCILIDYLLLKCSKCSKSLFFSFGCKNPISKESVIGKSIRVVIFKRNIACNCCGEIYKLKVTDSNDTYLK